jgi:hypothetical protein
VKLDVFFDTVRPLLFAQARDRIRSHMSGLTSEEAIRVTALCVVASGSSLRDPLLCVDSGFNVWLRGRYAYLVPIGEGWIFDNVIGRRLPVYAKSFGLVDYAFEDATDVLQREIGMRAWKARRRVWDELLGGSGQSHNARRLWHEVLELKNGAPWWFHAYILGKLGKGLVAGLP